LKSYSYNDKLLPQAQRT